MKLRASIKWVGWIMGAVILVGVIALVNYLHTPTPPPQVSLNVLQFEQDGTNLYAVCMLKNQGRVRLWSDPFDWQIEAETAGQWSTNVPTRLSWYDWDLQPGSNRVFSVPVPTNATSWRVIRYYEYMERPSLRWDYLDSLPNRKKPGKIAEWVCNVLAQFDPESTGIGEVASQFITNSLIPTPIKLGGPGSKATVPSQPSH